MDSAIARQSGTAFLKALHPVSIIISDQKVPNTNRRLEKQFGAMVLIIRFVSNFFSVSEGSTGSSDI